MTVITYDTLKFVEKLKKSGIPENQAKAISNAFAEAHIEAEIATKSDIGVLKSDISALKSELKSDMRELEYRLIIKLGTMMTIAVGLIVTLNKVL